MNVAELMETPLMRGATLEAGANGLEREVTWCISDSSLDFDNWIMPGMLVLNTNANLGISRDDYQNRLIRAQAAAIIDFDHPEGSKEPLVDADFSNANDIPLIRMHNKANVVTFSKRFVSVFVTQYSDEMRREEWLRDVCAHEPNASAISSAASYGYREDYSYYCLLLDISDRGETDPVVIEMDAGTANSTLVRRLSSKDAQVLSYIDGAQVVALVPVDSKMPQYDVRQHLIDAVNEVRRHIHAQRCKAVIGSCAPNLRSFCRSYSNALATQDVIHMLGVHDKVSFYDDWYMHMLLLKEPKGELKEHMEHTLAPIMDSPELLETLTNYLVLGENLKLTSEKMFIHVNTLKYRLKRIRELLGVDLKDPNTRFRLRMAITIERYLHC